MPKFEFPESIRFIEVDLLKRDRFSFINDDVLRENAAINMQYIVFLYSLADKSELPGSVLYSVYKTIIIYTASIVEGLIYYKLKMMIEEGRIQDSDILKKMIEYKHVKDILELEEGVMLCAVRKTERQQTLSHDTIFQELNRAAKRCGLFDSTLFKRAQRLREKRNKIHLSGLSDVDDKYSKKQVDNVFTVAKLLINRIEEY